MMGFKTASDQARLGRMLELPVTAPHAYLNPTVTFKQLDNLADLHA
jgi:hypothetical protein